MKFLFAKTRIYKFKHVENLYIFNASKQKLVFRNKSWKSIFLLYGVKTLENNIQSEWKKLASNSIHEKNLFKTIQFCKTTVFHILTSSERSKTI